MMSEGIMPIFVTEIYKNHEYNLWVSVGVFKYNI